MRVLSKIRNLLLGQGKMKKYMFYAIGEIILVVVGILIALQVNNWNEDRKMKTVEVKTLQQLLASLELEKDDLDLNNGSISGSIQSIDVVIKHLENELPYHDSLNFHFGNSNKMMGFVVNPAVYENLKFTGLDLISNEDLRNKIVSHYDYKMPYLKQIEEGFVQPLHAINFRPWMIENFEYRGVFAPAKPLNYSRLFKDEQYLGLLYATREAISFQLGRTRSLLKSAVELKAMIEEELETRGIHVQ